MAVDVGSVLRDAESIEERPPVVVVPVEGDDATIGLQEHQIFESFDGAPIARLLLAILAPLVRSECLREERREFEDPHSVVLRWLELPARDVLSARKLTIDGY